MPYRDDLAAAHARIVVAEVEAATAKATLADVLHRLATNNVMMPPPAIFIGIGGYVVAVAPTSGQVLWQHKLTASGAVNVVYDQGVLLAGVAGKVFRLDPLTGAELWRNSLRGYGMGLPCLVVVPHPLPPLATVFVGIASSLLALAVDTGAEHWKTKLTGAIFSATDLISSGVDLDIFLRTKPFNSAGSSS